MAKKLKAKDGDRNLAYRGLNMTITATLVKELRERTGAGMMDCKKALVETNADLEAAIDLMRASGAAKAAKKAGRIASEGLVNVVISDDNKSAAILEVNSETDFVTKGQSFIDFVNALGKLALKNKPDIRRDISNSNIKTQARQLMKPEKALSPK